VCLRQIAPPPAPTAEPEEVPIKPEEAISNDAVSVEHAYVPLSQRQTLASQVVEDDSIVVVGRRQKKRKRVQVTRATEPKPSVESTSASAEQTPEVEEEFDYSSVPNILDDVAPQVDAPKKKKQKQKGMPVLNIVV
jgi:exosome complex exonuclease RRP6